MIENLNIVDVIALTIILVFSFIYFYIKIGVSVAFIILQTIQKRIKPGKTESINLERLAIISSLWPLVLVFVAIYLFFYFIYDVFYSLIVKKILREILNVYKNF